MDPVHLGLGYSYSYLCWSRLLASAQLPKATADGVRPFLQVAATGVHPDEFSLQSAVRRSRHLYFLRPLPAQLLGRIDLEIQCSFNFEDERLQR